MLDAELLARLRSWRFAPAAERVGPLRALVLENPDSTPAAVALLLALRQAGMFALERDDAGASPSRVPPRIVQFWFQGAPPPDVAVLMQSWRRHNPDHELRLFDDSAAQGWLAAHVTPDALKAYRRAREPAQKADLFRLAVLFSDGGYYADADDLWLAPLRSILPPRTAFGAYQEEFGTVGNNLLAAAPGHPVLGRALKQAVEATNRGDSDLVWLSNGPGLLTRAFAQELAEGSAAIEERLAGTALLGRSQAARAVAMHVRLFYKSTEQHWLRSAFGKRNARGLRGGGRPQQS